jgi:hypothetical protein
MPLPHRHGYAAGIHRGLPLGDANQAKSSPTASIAVEPGTRGDPAHIHQVGAGACLEERYTLVSHVHLSGSPGALLRRGPLRTRRATFTAPGSSKPHGSRAGRSAGSCSTRRFRRQCACTRRTARSSSGVPGRRVAEIASLRTALRVTLSHCSHSSGLCGSWSACSSRPPQIGQRPRWGL